MTPNNVSDFLLNGKPPDQIALRMIGRDYSYGELDNAAFSVAAYLHRISAIKGDRVILIAENSFFWVAAYLGIMRAGCACVPLVPTLPHEILDYILETTGATVVFADGRVALQNKASFKNCHVVTAALLPGSREYCGKLPPVEATDLAALMFTSGSTGQPRGVMVSHGNIIANTNSIVEYLELTAADRMMTVLPFHYCFGASLMHTHLRVGASLVLDSRFMYPEMVLQRMIDTRCTGFAGVPSHYQILLQRSSLSQRQFPDLRAVQQAGGPLAPHFIRELRAALPGTKIFIMYGQTEATARLSYLPPDLIEAKLGSVGKGIPGTKLSVLNESGDPVRPGEVGEIVAQGENVTGGYWRAHLETAAAFRNGKLYTGDLATVDPDGFIYVVGRSKDFLKCAGKRVSCRQLEEQVLRFEGVVEAAVVAMPDAILGDAVRLFVVARDGDAAHFSESLRRYCRSVMPPSLVPKEIVSMEFLPKNSAGKILKEQLKRDAETGNPLRPG